MINESTTSDVDVSMQSTQTSLTVGIHRLTGRPYYETEKKQECVGGSYQLHLTFFSVSNLRFYFIVNFK